MTTPHEEPPHGQEPPHGPHGQEPELSAATPPSVRKRRVTVTHLAFAAVGLGAGLVAGLGLGQIDFSQPSDAIPQAVEACDAKGIDGISVGDDGQSVSMQSEGAESVGAPYADVACVLMELETADSVIARIDSTRALDGRLSGEWGEFSASWGYHPDNGLNIVVEVVASN